jgi:hypothetical protein
LPSSSAFNKTNEDYLSHKMGIDLSSPFNQYLDIEIPTWKYFLKKKH